MKMYDGYTITKSHQDSQLLPCCFTDAVVTVPLFEAIEVQGFITSPAYHPRFTLFLQSVIAVYAVQLLVLNNGHETSTEHRFFSAILVTLALGLKVPWCLTSQISTSSLPVCQFVHFVRTRIFVPRLHS